MFRPCAQTYRLARAHPTAESRDIAAPAEKVWYLVSDLPALSKGIGSTPSFLFRRQSSHDVRGRDSIAGPSTLLQA